MMKKRLKGISLFASAGIGETYFKDVGIDIVVANELLEKRANLYSSISPETRVVCGDITNEKIFNQIIASCPEKVDFMLASPPCQGMSVAGKNRCQETMESDKRNYLITYVVKAIKLTTPDYILIENVPALLKLKLMYDSEYRTVLEILEYEFGSEYIIDSAVIDSSDYGVPQTRLRAIIKMHKPNTVWNWPAKKEKVTKDGTRIKGYESSYRRIRWDAPSPTITIRNDCIASQRNVHPGRLLPDGTYSDARVLTPLELMLLNSLPADWNIPDNTPELLIRQCIGESIPPLMLKEIVRGIYDEQD